MADSIELFTPSGEILDAMRPRVYVADKLGRNWTLVEYLYCDGLKVQASPLIDEARLSYIYGPIIRENDSDDAPGAAAAKLVEPQDLIGKFVRIIVPGMGVDDDDFYWYGLIETDAKELLGSMTDGDLTDGSEDSPRGVQLFIALGLARLLELQPVRTSSIANTIGSTGPQSNLIAVAEGLPFNGNGRGELDERGNMYFDNATQSAIFSELPAGADLWDAGSAAEYLLADNLPLDQAGTPVCQWKIVYDSGSLDWYDVTVKTDGRTLKEVLDELIPRRRGVGWFVEFDEDQGYQGMAQVTVFSFLKDEIEAITGAEPVSIAANPDQKSLDFETAFDAEVELTNTISQQFDEVVAQGAFRTTTLTFPFTTAAGVVQPDWTAADETSYLNGASGEVGYGVLNTEAQYQRNRVWRTKDQLRHVFRRYRLATSWTQTITASTGKVYCAAPKLNTETVPISNTSDLKNQGEWKGNYELGLDTEMLWVRGLEIMAKMPLKDRGDYTGTKIADGTFEQDIIPTDDDGMPNYEYLKPLFFTQVAVPNGNAECYQLLDRLNENADDAEFPCRWSVSARIVDKRPAFDLAVAGAPQQVIAKTRFAGVAFTDPEEDPNQNPDLCGRDYTEFWATLTLRLQKRVQIVRQVTSADNQVPGRPKRQLIIDVPDARLDWVMPDTVVAIKDGIRQRSTTGGFVRNDTGRLRVIAEAAAAWYGQTRQTVSVALKHCREVVKLGWLITDVGPTYSIEGVNTPVTSITYDFANGKSSFQTAYAELEFSIGGE